MVVGKYRFRFDIGPLLYTSRAVPCVEIELNFRYYMSASMMLVDSMSTA